MVRRQLGEVRNDLIGGHPRRQVLQHVVDRDARTDETRLAAANIGSHIDQRDQVHDATLPALGGNATFSQAMVGGLLVKPVEKPDRPCSDVSGPRFCGWGRLRGLLLPRLRYVMVTGVPTGRFRANHMTLSLLTRILPLVIERPRQVLGQFVPWITRPSHEASTE